MTTLDTTNKICIPSLKILGDYWTLRIVDVLSGGELRYAEIKRRIDDMNPVTLSTRLKKLEANGLVRRTESSRADVSYALTELGHQAVPVLEAVNAYSRAANTTGENA
jgi:DNA-binding HxlR family transcriptional regulator